MTNLRLWDQLAKKCTIPRCKTHSKRKLASEVSRSGQNFPLPMFFKVPFYTLQSQETFHSEFLLRPVDNHVGRHAKQPQERGGTPICGLYRYVSPNRIWFLSLRLWTGYKTQPSSLEDEYTVKPLLSRHLPDLPKSPLIEGVRSIKVRKNSTMFVND